MQDFKSFQAGIKQLFNFECESPVLLSLLVTYIQDLNQKIFFGSFRSKLGSSEALNFKEDMVIFIICKYSEQEYSGQAFKERLSFKIKFLMHNCFMKHPVSFPTTQLPIAINEYLWEKCGRSHSEFNTKLLWIL